MDGGKKIKFKRWTFALIAVSFYFYSIWLRDPLFKSPVSSVLLSENNELLAARISNDGQWRFPAVDSVPLKFRTCVLYFEDEYFKYHPGINPAAVIRSLKNNAASGKIRSGASTITMQVARMTRHKPRNYLNKLAEVLLALRIELFFSKENILNAYCSNAPFGSNVVGLGAASWRYFGRSPEHLSWAEAATLAVLPNAPSLIYPGKNQQRLLAKRNFLLKKLLDKKALDLQTYQLALLEPLPQKPFPIPQLAPHLLERCMSEHKDSTIFYSTISREIQAEATDLVNRHMQTLAANQVFNASVLVAETGTGKIIAYVGNSSSPGNVHENYVDIIRAPRSTGSILKPLLYAFMLNENKILPGALLEDVPTRIGSTIRSQKILKLLYHQSDISRQSLYSR